MRWNFIAPFFQTLELMMPAALPARPPDSRQFFQALGLRGTFIIDPDGVLKTVEMHDLGIGRSAVEALRKLEAAKFVREHGDQVCPAAWTPGDETLTPGLDLVGKI